MPDSYVTSRAAIIAFMRSRGWFPALASLSEAAALERIDRETLDHELKRYADWMGTEAVPDAPRFCALEDRPAFRGQDCGWPEKLVTWHVEGGLPNHSAADVKECAALSLTAITDVCGVQLAYSPNAKTANVFMHVPAQRPQGFGQGGGVLADAMLVPCGLKRNSEFQSEMRYDGAEKWTLEDRAPRNDIPYPAVLRHEFLHSLGLPHGPAGNLMAPTLGSIIKPAAWDKAELQKRYGPPASVPVPPSGPAPTPGKLTLTINNIPVTEGAVAVLAPGGRFLKT